MTRKEALRNFFYPLPGSPRWKYILPLIVIGVVVLIAIGGGTYGWEYTNSPEFCGSACHTMPPQNAVYVESPHANVTCEECHIGRTSFVNQLTRKSQGLKETYYQIFHLYELPIRARSLRPAVDTCEKCHRPETFADDSLRTITHFGNEIDNPSTSTYLVLKTGGGSKREGLGYGIHWHIENPVYYYASDELNQSIPYVRVMNEDGSYTEYVDVEADFDRSSIDESELKPIDCITCHNRVTHNFEYPQDSVDDALSRGTISPAIPEIRKRAVVVLSAEYQTHEIAFEAIDQLETYYKGTDFYQGNEEVVSEAIAEIKAIYDRTVFHDQEVTWTTHPNNLGHINAPGCFRCHDGKHLNDQDQAIRLECNLCHSIPVVADRQDFVANIEISRGVEPESHLNANWISLHNQSIDTTCANCHTTEDMGGTSNTSFCSNSACHGSVFSYAGFDAPALREILQAQIPTPAPTDELPPPPPNPTFENYIGMLFAVRCTECHGDTPSAELSFLSYASALKGSENGAVIIPGDSAGSKLVILQQGGKHFGLFSAEELDAIIAWITAGAPEK